MASGITPKLPLNIGEEGDFGLIKTYEELVKQNLKNLLLTNKGEKTMDSNFGVGIKSFLFEPNVPATYGIMEQEISDQISRYMPFLELEEIEVSQDPESDEGISVKIYYVITPLDVEDNLVLFIENLALI